jgi:hypothetical protein
MTLPWNATQTDPKSWIQPILITLFLLRKHYHQWSGRFSWIQKILAGFIIVEQDFLSWSKLVAMIEMKHQGHCRTWLQCQWVGGNLSEAEVGRHVIVVYSTASKSRGWRVRGRRPRQQWPITQWTVRRWRQWHNHQSTAGDNLGGGYEREGRVLPKVFGGVEWRSWDKFFCEGELSIMCNIVAY